VRPGLLGRQTAACRAVGVCRMPIVTRNSATDFEQSTFAEVSPSHRVSRKTLSAGIPDDGAVTGTVRSIERQNCFVSGISQLARGALEERIAHPPLMRDGRPACGVATGHRGGGCGGWPLRHQPPGEGSGVQETANRVGRIQHRDYGLSGGGFARLWLRRAGGERGDFTARTKAITRLVDTPRPLNASGRRIGAARRRRRA